MIQIQIDIINVFLLGFFFSVGNTKLNSKIKFNLLNFRKSNSLFNLGMKI